MLNIFKKLISLLDAEERKKMFLLVFMMLTMALLDMIGVASIFPFMVVLTDPGHVETNIYLSKLLIYAKFWNRKYGTISFCFRWRSFAIINYFTYV